MGVGGNDNPTLSHLLLTCSCVLTSDTVNGPFFLHCNLSYRLQTAMLDFNHETLLALTLHVLAYFEDLSVVCIVEFTGHLLSDRDTTNSTGMGAEVNGNNQWEWQGNGNKTRVISGLGMGMGINHWEWEGMGLQKIFPLISKCQSQLLRISCRSTSYVP